MLNFIKYEILDIRLYFTMKIFSVVSGLSFHGFVNTVEISKMHKIHVTL